MRWTAIFVFSAASASASPPIEALQQVIAGSFPQAPPLVISGDVAAECGGGATAMGVYCPSEGVVYLDARFVENTASPYVVAHLYGHALQVTYGVADIALAAIRADRSREAELRSMVTQQVECLAGVLIARSDIGLPPLDALYQSEPMTDAHWGANPVRNGPRVSIGLAARAAAFAEGRRHADPARCTVGEMSAALIDQADRWP